MKFFKQKSSLLVLILGLMTLTLITACSKKENQKQTPSLPSATSLINSSFAKNIKSGHYTLNLASKEMNQTTKASGKFKQGSVTYMDYAISNKSKTQSEKIWLTNSTIYLLLPANHGKWIENKSDANNFDPNQLTSRFKSSTLDAINQEFVKHAQVKKSGTSSYSVSYSGTNSDIWKVLNVLVVDTMNSPGSQNMNISRTINAASVQNIKINYIINKLTKRITNITYQASFNINGKYDFTWKQVYDELNEHNKLSVPNSIQKNAIDVQKIKQKQAKK
ncbi:uncharacterized protein (UPF0332 family) [Lactobacillus colini]|uniref:Uncharacterized protein (UPF0332 family) n=1 Tax=Lactobacillus colini TaxID=1819254 RepID=A0ABS4MCJ8_9LACO|nr:hypothetical protein [Lactobacillus colini]MBP2057405.1 uncharacterized protein (UPF0332 family) [Lactobacillus colini]